MRFLFLFVLIVVVGGCATTATTPAEPAEPDAPDATAPAADPRPDVTLNLKGPTMLGDFVATLAETSGGGIVVMNGLEYVPVKAQSWLDAPFERVIRDVAGSDKVKIEETPAYFFLYPPGYEVLEQVSLEGLLDPKSDAVTASIGFGYRTSMFEALAFMSSSLGITLLADQVIGDAQLGALNLAESPLHVCLGALLKSARVPPEAFEVESTPEYVFLHAKSNPPRPGLLNPLELTEAQNQFLDKKVSVTVPSRPLNVSNVENLGVALPVLSRQLGVEVVAPGLEKLPVSPAVFRDVPVRKVLELMIRQWPVPEFGYRVEENRIVIERTS